MFSNSSGLTPTDVLAMNGNSGFNEGGSWWLIILIFALIFGWNNNGGGLFGGNTSGGVTDGYILTSDFASLERQMENGFDGIRQQGVQIANGLSSLGYDQLAQMNNINTNINATGNAIQNAITQDTIANMQNVNALSSQLANCCCENEKATLQSQYNLATESCQTRQAIADAKADILNAINQQSVDAMQSKIAEQSQIINNQYLVSQINKVPIPSYQVANPYTGYYFNGTTIA